MNNSMNKLMDLISRSEQTTKELKGLANTNTVFLEMSLQNAKFAVSSGDAVEVLRAIKDLEETFN